MAGPAPIPVPETAVWFYTKGGLSCRELGEMFDVSESTAQRWMKAAGVIRSDAGKAGRPLAEKCVAGHRQDIWRRRDRNGATYCALCKARRGRESYANAKAEHAMEPESYGRMAGTFSSEHPVDPGACPRCGAYPPCEPPKGN